MKGCFRTGLKSLASGTLVLMMLGSATFTHAQDILGSTGQTTRSYNYFEGFYLYNIDRDLPDEFDYTLPILLRLSVDLNERFSVWVEHRDISGDLEGVENGVAVGFSLDATSTEIGLRYRGTLTQMANTDWRVGVAYGQVTFDFNFDVGDESFGDDLDGNFTELYAGIRRTLLPRLEGELALIHQLIDEGDDATSGEAVLVYRVAESIDVALGGTDIGEADNYGIGLRYTWK